MYVSHSTRKRTASFRRSRRTVLLCIVSHRWFMTRRQPRQQRRRSRVRRHRSRIHHGGVASSLARGSIARPPAVVHKRSTRLVLRSQRSQAESPVFRRISNPMPLTGRGKRASQVLFAVVRIAVHLSTVAASPCASYRLRARPTAALLHPRPQLRRIRSRAGRTIRLPVPSQPRRLGQGLVLAACWKVAVVEVEPIRRASSRMRRMRRRL